MVQAARLLRSPSHVLTNYMPLDFFELVFIFIACFFCFSFCLVFHRTISSYIMSGGVTEQRILGHVFSFSHSLKRGVNRAFFGF